MLPDEDGSAPPVTNKVEPKIEAHLPKVLHVKLCCHVFLKGLELVLATCSQCEIINIDKDIEELASSPTDEEACIYRALCEAKI